VRQQQQQQWLFSIRMWSGFPVSSILCGNAGEGIEREYHDRDTLRMGHDANDANGGGGGGGGFQLRISECRPDDYCNPAANR